MKVAAIIPAAGSGTRMRSTSPKQFMTLVGQPIILHSLHKFASCKLIDRIIVPLRESDLDEFQAVIEEQSLSEVVDLVPGGAHRQESVYNGFREVSEDTDVVVVHDAVRPFVEVGLIEAVIHEAYKNGSAVLAIPSVDTIKQIEKKVIVATLQRDKIVLVQTPQAFRYEIIKEGFEKARTDNFHATDESSLVERLGYQVHVIRGSEFNIKITKPSDLPFAELLMQRERISSNPPNPQK